MDTPTNPPTAKALRFGSHLIELVDALVEAVDLERTTEVERLARALEPFGACRLFTDELRLNGLSSSDSQQ